MTDLQHRQNFCPLTPLGPFVPSTICRILLATRWETMADIQHSPLSMLQKPTVHPIMVKF